MEQYEKSIVVQKLEQWDKFSRYEEPSGTSELELIMRNNKDKLEIALDTETTGLDTITAKCLGYSFSFEPNVAYWVPIKLDPRMRVLKQLVKDKIVIFFNAGYDLAIVEKYKVRIPDDMIKDVSIACFFRDIDGYERNAGLKVQSEEILHLPTVGMKDIICDNEGLAKYKENDTPMFLRLEPWQQRIYGCQDADITMQLWREDSIQAAIKTMPEIWELEHQVIRPVMRMHQAGLGFDHECNAKMDKILIEECAKCSSRAHEIALKECTTYKDDGVVRFKNEELERLSRKKGLNLGSFAQKQHLLFGASGLGIPTTHKTKGGWSTDQLALTEIEGEHEIIPLIMRYNKLKSRRSSYTNKLPGLVNPATGRIHPSLWQTGAKSGRFSCSNPNAQGISKDQDKDDPVKIREIFIPSKGNILTAADYSQVEVRIAASLSQEPVWCDEYNGGKEDIDVHTITASEMYGVALDKVTKDQRSIAKTANFSILTGISAYTLSARNRRTLPTVEDAQALIDRWFKALPRLTMWIEETHRQIRLNKQAESYFGRVRPFLEARDPEPSLIALRVQGLKEREWARDKSYDQLRGIAIRSLTKSAERKGLSHVIQGTAADIMKISIVKVDKALQKAKLPNTKMILTVHDELLFDHPPEVKDELHELLHKQMTFKKLGPGWVPLPIDIGYGANWGEAH